MKLRKKFKLLLWLIIGILLLPSGGSAESEFSLLGEWNDREALSDGDPTTRAEWSKDELPELYLLMGEEMVISGIILSAHDRLETVEIAYSPDAINWTPLEKIEMEERQGESILRFAPRAVRALRITVTTDKRPWHMGGIELVRFEKPSIDVSQVRVEEIGENSAVVKWTTNYPVRTRLLYGYRLDNLQTLNSPSFDFQTEHSVRLEGLLPGLDYYVWILAEDRAFGRAADHPWVFKTAGTPFPMPYHETVRTGLDTAHLTFVTNIPSLTWIEWRRSDGESEFDGDPVGVVVTGGNPELSHAVEIAGLEPRRTYDWRIICEDTAGRKTTTPWLKFSTATFNLAKGKPATGTFNLLLDEQRSEDNRPALERITDGRLDYFTGMATSGDPEETHQWVEVDLGEARELSTIELIWRGNAYPASFSVMTSPDGTNWSYPAVGISAATGREERSSRGDPLRRIVLSAPENQKVRFIKVFIPKASPYFTRARSWNFVQLAEIEAHGRWGWK